MTPTRPDSCSLCGGAPAHADPLVQDSFYEGVGMHLHRINSAEGRDWTRRQADRIVNSPGTWSSPPWEAVGHAPDAVPSS